MNNVMEFFKFKSIFKNCFEGLWAVSFHSEKNLGSGLYESFRAEINVLGFRKCNPFFTFHNAVFPTLPENLNTKK